MMPWTELQRSFRHFAVSRSDEYREIAKECIASARMSRSKQQRKQLVELAKTWMAAASLLDQGAETAAGRRQVGTH